MIQASIQRDRVITACQNYFAEREVRIKADIDKAVAKHMKPHVGFLAWLWNRMDPPAKTREEAIERVKDPERGAFGSEWYWIHLKGSDDNKGAKKMLALAEATPVDFVVLDQDGQWILKYEDRNADE